MKQLEVNINQAQIESFRISMNDNLPQVSATIGLYVGQKKITDFTVSTDAWKDENKFDLPYGIVEPIVQIAKQLEDIVILKCRQQLRLLSPIREDQ